MGDSSCYSFQNKCLDDSASIVNVLFETKNVSNRLQIRLLTEVRKKKPSQVCSIPVWKGGGGIHNHDA